MKLLFAVLCLLCAIPCPASPPAVVIVLLPPATLREWQTADAPALHRLMQTGALGVLNTRTAHRAGHQERETVQGALLTLAAGARAAGFPPARFLPASSPAPGVRVSAAALFERRTGTRAGPGQSVCLEWPAVLAANQNVGYDLRLGSLADTLAAQRVSVASGGAPEADWLAAGGDGAVRQIPVLRALPGRCLVWDAGPDIASADTVLSRAAAQVAALQGRLVVLSPAAGDAAQRQLAPVLVWGPDIPAGLLRSPSTRRPGLVTNTDFAPSVAALFGIPRTQFGTAPFGFAWSYAAATDAAGVCDCLNTEAVQQSQAMRLLPYTAAALGFWIVCVTLLTARFAVPGAALFVPTAVLAAALFASSALSFGLLLVALLALFTLSSRFIGSALLTAAGISLTVAVCADAVTGNVLMHRGLLGYSALEGARYYGIGNEAMGLLLGAALVAAARLRPPNQSGRFALLAAMAGIIVLLGTAGAKAGGVLVSLFVFGTFYLTDARRRWTFKTGAALVGVVLAGLAAAALGDAFLHAGNGSHIGEAVRRITSGGPQEAWDIVRRKLAVEGLLAYHSAWAALLWLGLLCTAWLWRTTPAPDSRDTALRSAGVVGIAACLLLNDAGVVAAAIFTTLLWSAAMTQKSLPILDKPRTGRR